jgi:hypothetical protein
MGHAVTVGTEGKVATVDARRERDFLAAVLAAPDEGGPALEVAVAGEHLVTPAAVGIVPWVQKRLGGNEEQPPAGLESEAAAILAGAGRYEDRGAAAVHELAARVELTHVRRERDVLKQKLATDDDSGETQRALVRLDRRIAELEEGLRGA